MRIAHLIVTYTNPLQTERMIRRLMHPQVDIYIHLDKKNDIKDHLFLKEVPNVFFIKNRVDVRWAGLSTVEAVLNSIEEIVQTGIYYDYVALLSGQEYPIKTADYIVDFYAKNKGKLFMKFDAFEGDWEEALDRVNKYYMTDFKFKGRYLVEKIMNLVLPVRKPPIPLKFYGRSMFWSLSLESLQYVLKLLKEQKGLKRFFRFTWAPDEFLFQTLILNSPFADKVVNENCHYYQHKPHEPHPKFLTKEDFPEIQKSAKLYARKFNAEVDSEVLDMIDEMLGEQSNDKIVTWRIL